MSDHGETPQQQSSDDVGQFVVLRDRRVRMCFDQGGNPDGPDLVVINGTGSDLRNHPNAFAWPIAKHFHITTWDHRGLGRSASTEADYQPSMADFAADGMALIDTLGIESFHVLGVSFGGMVAQELALLAGDRLERLILAITSSGGAGGSSYPLHEIYEAGERLDTHPEYWDVRADSDPKVRATVERIFNGAVQDEPSTGQLAQIEARRHHDMWDRLPNISATTMVTFGTYDGIAPPANARALASQLPNAVTAEFDGGHFCNWQDRSAWPTMIDFLLAES